MPKSKWKHNIYRAVIPKKIDKLLTEDKHLNDSVYPDTQVIYSDAQTINPDDTKVLTEDKPNSTYNSKKNSSYDEPAQNLVGVLDGSYEHYEIPGEEFEKLRKKINRFTIQGNRQNRKSRKRSPFKKAE
jgi:hypothetical protein